MQHHKWCIDNNSKNKSQFSLITPTILVSLVCSLIYFLLFISFTSERSKACLRQIQFFVSVNRTFWFCGLLDRKKEILILLWKKIKLKSLVAQINFLNYWSIEHLKENQYIIAVIIILVCNNLIIGFVIHVIWYSKTKLSEYLLKTYIMCF